MAHTLYIDAGAIYNASIMAYDHLSDLPPEYPVSRSLYNIERPLNRSYWSRRAERANYLNRIAGVAIRNIVNRDAGERKVDLADLGVQMYEIATLPELAGVNSVDEPTYTDVSGGHAAQKAVSLLLRHQRATVRQLEQASKLFTAEVPTMAGLIKWAATGVHGHEVDEPDMHTIKAGAAMLRYAHIQARLRLNVDEATGDHWTEL